jgi:CxxC-x17-CxxC domain-containing protein
MNFIDRMLRCSDCGEDFIFTAGEQLFFSDREFKNDPKRCKACKAKRAVAMQTAGGPRKSVLGRVETRTSCSGCGIDTTVPFKPTQGRPVLCRACFNLQKAAPLSQMAAVSAVAAMHEHGEVSAGREMRTEVGDA